MDFDTARLRAFAHVAARGTVAAAARSLGYTAPAVSQQVAKLEAQLGAALFDRVGGRLRLSAAGRQLLPVAEQMLELADLAVAEGSPPSGDRHLVVAGLASAIQALVVPLLGTASPPHTTFEVLEMEDESALRELRLGTVDVALVQEYDGVPEVRPPQLALTPVLVDPLRLVVPPSHTRRVALTDLADAGWLMNGDGTRCEMATHRLLLAAGITPRITGRIGDHRTLLALVAAGHGCTIVPALVAGIDADVTIASADLGAGRTIFAARRAATTGETDDVVERLVSIGRRRRRRP